MGEFSQNLLKLTEFPFSYSLIGLLALIFGQGSGVEELDFAKLGPLLILMGFLATILSICDPVGAIQRYIIKGREPVFSWDSEVDPKTGAGGIYRALRQTIFSRYIPEYFGEQRSSALFHTGRFNTPVYMLSMLMNGSTIRQRYPTFDRLVPEPFEERPHFDWDWLGSYLVTATLNTPWRLESPNSPKITKHDYTSSLEQAISDFEVIFKMLDAERQKAVRTKWVTAEIDRITALFYFIIIISLFIIATLVYPGFFQHFSQNFSEIQIAKLVILILSTMGLGAVIIILRIRIKGLRDKASIVFQYLLALESIKFGPKDFKITLQDIERYLNDNDWTLAEYWVERVLTEYRNLFREVVNEPNKTLEEK